MVCRRSGFKQARQCRRNIEDVGNGIFFRPGSQWKNYPTDDFVPSDLAAIKKLIADIAWWPFPPPRQGQSWQATSYRFMAECSGQKPTQFCSGIRSPRIPVLLVFARHRIIAPLSAKRSTKQVSLRSRSSQPTKTPTPVC